LAGFCRAPREGEQRVTYDTFDFKYLKFA
jgi:hypothetical protein